MANVRVLVKLRYEGIDPQFYDVSSRVNYDELRWESNSEGTSANCNLALWTILPKSANTYKDYAGATVSDQINAAILDESFVIEIPNKAEIRIVDSSQSPMGVLFAGIITRVSTERQGGVIKQSIECADNTAILEEHIIADYYAPRDSRDIDIINGGIDQYTVARSLPKVIGSVDAISVVSEPTGGSLSDGTYYIRIQPITTKMVGRDGAYPQYGPATKQTKITISGGTSTQRLKVSWKNAYMATTHNVHVMKDSTTAAEYLGKAVKTLTEEVIIIKATRSSNVVSVETKTNHGLVAGDPIVVSIPQSSGFSADRKDFVVVDSVQSSTKFKYKNTGDDGAASVVGATVTSGSFTYISSLATSGAVIPIAFQSARGWADGEVYEISTESPGEQSVGLAEAHNGYYSGSYFRLGIGSNGLRDWQYPANIFGGMFEKAWADEIGLNTREYVEAVDTLYRFSPYFSESDTPNAEQFGGRTLRNALDYISSKTGAEYWVDKGYYDAIGEYHCNLHYRSKTTNEMVSNGVYDGTLDGWSAIGGFDLSNAFAGPYGSGYVAYSGVANSYIEQSVEKRSAVVPNQVLFIAVRGKASDHQNRWGAYIDWYDSSGTEIHSDHLGNLSQAGSWERIWKIIKVPSGAAYAGLRGTCTDQQHGFAYFTDWSMVMLTGAMGYGDFEDVSSYAVPIYEMEIPQSPVESGGSANRLHLYAVFRTKDSNGDKVALLDSDGNPVQYVDYDFTPGIWATSGKIVEAAITDQRVETLDDAELAAAAYWKENGLPIESYTFQMRPYDAYGNTYAIPEVGEVIPFIWNVLGVAKPLIVKSVLGEMQGTDVVYTVTVGGDIRLQRSSFIRLSEKIKELANVNPIPDIPDTPLELAAVSNEKAISLSWKYNETSEVNKNVSSFEVQRQDGIYKAISMVQKAGSTVTITTDGSHGLVVNDTVRIDLNTTNENLLKVEGQWIVSSKTTTSFTYVSTDTTTEIPQTSIDGWAYYNYSEFRVVQNSKATYVVDSGLYPALQYRYKVRALSSEGTASSFTKSTEPINPSYTQATVADGSVTLEKLQSTLRPIVIISDEALPDLNPNGLSAYPEGTIVYHLGGTPPGLRRAAKNPDNPSGSQWSWENAVTGTDIVSNTITSEKISTVGLDASVIKSGQLTIDNRFGLSSNKSPVIAYSGSGQQATIYTNKLHGITSGTINVGGIGGTFDGDKTFKDTRVNISHKQRAGNKATLRTQYKHGLVVGDNIEVTSVDAAFDGGPYAIDTVHSNIVAKQQVGNMATISTDNAHGFSVNDKVTITGADAPFDASDQAQATILATQASVTFKQHDGTNALLTTQYAHGYREGDTVVTASNNAPYDGTFTVNGTNIGVNYPSRIGGVATLRTSIQNPIVVGDKVKIDEIGAPYNGEFEVSNVSAPIYSYQSTGRSYALSHAGRVSNRAIVRTSAVQTIAADDVVTVSGSTVNQSNATVLSAGEKITGYASGISVTNRRNGCINPITAVSMNDSSGLLSAGGSVIGRAIGRSVNYWQITAASGGSSTIQLFTGRYASTTAFDHYMGVGEQISVRGLTVTIGGQSVSFNGIYRIASVPSSSSFTFTIPIQYSVVAKTATTGSTACVVGEYADLYLNASSNFPTSTAANPNYNDMPVIVTGVGSSYNSFDIPTTSTTSPTNKFYLPPSGRAAQVGTRVIRIHLANATPSTGGRILTATTTTIKPLSLASLSQVTDQYPVYEFNGNATSLTNGFTTVSGGSISNGLALMTSTASSGTSSGVAGLSSSQVVKISGLSDSRFNITTTVASIPSTSTFYVDLPSGTQYTSNLSSQTGRITNGVVTLTTASAHGYAANDTIAVSGITAQSKYNGLVTALTGTTGSTLVYKIYIDPSKNSENLYGETGTSNSAGASSNGTITFDTEYANGFIANDSVTITGVSTNINGTYTVTSGSSTGSAPVKYFSIKKSIDANFEVTSVTNLSGFATTGKTFSYTTSSSGSVNWATSTGSADANEATFVTTIPHGFIAGDSVTISGITSTGSSLNGTYLVARDGIRVASVVNTTGNIEVTCGAPHGLIAGDPVSLSGVGSGLDGDYTVVSISQVSGSGNPDKFVITQTGNANSETLYPSDGNAYNGKIFRVRTNAVGASAIAYATASAGTASTGKTFSYTTTGSSGYIAKSLRASDGTADNAKIFTFAVASNALSRASSTGNANNYKTFRYQVATSGFVPSTEILPLGSGIAKNGQTITYTISGSSILAPTSATGYVTNGRVIRYDNTTSQSLLSISGAEVSQRISVYSISAPNFKVTYDGTLTAEAGTVGGWTMATNTTGGNTYPVLSSNGIVLQAGTSNSTTKIVAGSNFSVNGNGALSATSATLDSATLNTAKLTSVELYDSSSGPGILIRKAASAGDIAVPLAAISSASVNERMSLGHLGASNAFTERLAIVGGTGTDLGDIYLTGKISAAGVTNRSDIRYKKNIRNFWIDPNSIYDLPIIEYEWDNEKLLSDFGQNGVQPEGTFKGIAAQDVQIALPWAYYEKTENSVASYSQQGILFAAISAIQDLNERIKELERQIAELEG